MGSASSTASSSSSDSKPPAAAAAADAAPSSPSSPTPTPQATVSPSALSSPAFTALRNRRVVLASSSPRRREILASVGLHPEIVPSTFEEDLPKSDFAGEEGAYAYPVETAARKAVQVWRRLVREDEDVASVQGGGSRPAPDLVIAADTVVVKDGEILEKPLDSVDHARMIAELNDGECQVVTGVTLLVPSLSSPGYALHSLSERTKVHFASSPPSVLQAYVACGEGADRAGGFAIQERGALLVRSIQGDYNNVVGFPLFSFCAFLHELVETEQIAFEG